MSWLTPGAGRPGTAARPRPHGAGLGGLVEPGEEIALIHLVMVVIGMLLGGAALTFAGLSAAARPHLLRLGLLTRTPTGTALSMPWLHGAPVYLHTLHLVLMAVGLVLLLSALASLRVRRARQAVALLRP